MKHPYLMKPANFFPAGEGDLDSVIERHGLGDGIDRAGGRMALAVCDAVEDLRFESCLTDVPLRIKNALGPSLESWLSERGASVSRPGLDYASGCDARPFMSFCRQGQPGRVDIEVVGEFNWAQALADFSVGNRQGETKAAVLIVVGLSFKSFAPPGSMTSQLRAHEERAREEEVLGESGSPHLREVFADPVNPAFLELVLNELEKPSQRTRSRMRQLYEKAWANTAWLQDNEAAGSLPELNEPPDGASSAGEADSLSALNDQPESAGSERLAERILAEALAGAPSKSKEEVDQVSPPPFPILVIGISAHRGSPDGGGAEAVRMSGRRGKAVRKAG